MNLVNVHEHLLLLLRSHGHEEAAEHLESLGPEASAQFLSQSATELFESIRRLSGLPGAVVPVSELVNNTTSLQN
jgi:hypothetical protein